MRVAPGAATRERIALLAIPVLLVVVALVQIARAVTLDQSSFAGYGFGMFATYENQLSRWTETYGIHADGRVICLPPRPDLDLAVREVPTEANLEALARALAGTDPSIESVHSQVWTIEVSGRPMRLERVLLNEVEVAGS